MILNLGGGVDRFPNTINVDKDKYRLINGDILHDLETPLKLEKKANLIIAKEIIEHIEDPEIFLDNCYDLLCEDGVLFLSTNNRDSLINRVFKSYYHPEGIGKDDSKTQEQLMELGPNFSIHKSLMNADELLRIIKKRFNILFISFLPYEGTFSKGRKLLHRFLPNSLRERIIVVAVKKSRRRKNPKQKMNR